MSDYIPATDEVRELYKNHFDPAAVQDHDGGEEFDRWYAAEMREARAETWDEAIAAVFAWWNAPKSERPAMVVNPYGLGLPNRADEMEGEG